MPAVYTVSLARAFPPQAILSCKLERVRLYCANTIRVVVCASSTALCIRNSPVVPSELRQA
eukprot:6463045-Amphidinium_carterae.1